MTALAPPGIATTEPDSTQRDDLLVALAALPERHPSRPTVRRQAIEAWLPLAHHVAHRFTGKGEPVADLVQVACVGLIKAIDRFDPSWGNGFAAFAVPTISGELKRYFRDQTWMVHVPRHLRELRLAIRRRSDELAQQLGHLPTSAELAEVLQVPEQHVIDAIRAGCAHTTASLDEPIRGAADAPGAAMADLLGQEDAELALVELRQVTRAAVATLSDRDRRILRLRYFHDMSQAQIAARLGISQMHVSRLLARILAALRSQLEEPAQP